jgi:hypothetical protein
MSGRRPVDEADANLTAAMVALSLAELNQSRQASGAASTDGFALIALNAAGVIGLGNAAAARGFPHRWWWVLPGFFASAVTAVLVRLVPESVVVLGAAYNEARAHLPDEAEANRRIASRLLQIADRNLRAARRKEVYVRVSLVLLALTVLAAVVLSWSDIR